jgi:hypothetical protein
MAGNYRHSRAKREPRGRRCGAARLGPRLRGNYEREDCAARLTYADFRTFQNSGNGDFTMPSIVVRCAIGCSHWPSG